MPSHSYRKRVYIAVNTAAFCYHPDVGAVFELLMKALGERPGERDRDMKCCLIRMY